MRNRNVQKFFVVLFLLVCFSTNAQIRLPKLISDGLVLQRETPLNIWGWASPNDAIKLSFDNQTFQTKANNNGEW